MIIKISLMKTVRHLTFNFGYRFLNPLHLFDLHVYDATLGRKMNSVFFQVFPVFKEKFNVKKY